MITGGQQVQGPAHTVHGDYTLTSAPERLRQLSKPPGKNDTLRSIIGDTKSLLPVHTVNDALSNGRFQLSIFGEILFKILLKLTLLHYVMHLQ